MKFWLNRLRDEIRRRNLKAGWAKEPNWFQKIFPVFFKKRSKPLLIALIHSEVSEALEGARKDLNDDHLPQFKMDEVEIVDALIRIMDYCGEYNVDIDSILRAKLEYNENREDHKPKNRKKSGGKKF